MRNGCVRLCAACFLWTVWALLFNACGLSGYLGGDIETLRPKKIDMPEQYTVTFDANGGSGTGPAAQTVNEDSLMTLPNEGDLFRDGFDFGGWNTEADGTGITYPTGSAYAVTGDAVLYARWNPPHTINYTVTFDANGGSGMVPAQTVTAGSLIMIPGGSGLSFDDYTFGGWNSATEGTGITYPAGSAYTVTDDVTLYAIWNPPGTIYCTVSFDANGGNGAAPAAQTVSEDSIITLPNRGGLSCEGFIFGGWNTQADGRGDDYEVADYYTVTDDATLYARWIPIDTEFTVTFDANGGSGAGPAPQTVTAGTVITIPNQGDLFRDGFNFGGWNTQADDTGITCPAGSAYTVTGDITRYARWIPTDTEFTVTFDANGGGGAVPAPQTVTAGSVITLPNRSGLFYEGFIFGGWNTQADGMGDDYEFADSYTVTADITLYAKWIPEDTPFTVTFDANGGSGTPPSEQSVLTGTLITLPNEGGLARNDDTFGGWNTEADGTGISYPAGSSYTVIGDVTLYARWIPPGTKFTVTYDANGGSGTAPVAQTVDAGTVITLPNRSGLSRTGYTFGGWNTESDCTGDEYEFADFYTVTDNVTLYAKWNPITYTVRYDKNAADADGTMINSSHTYDIDKTLSPNAYNRTGYTFAGWSAESGGGGTNYTNSQSVRNLSVTAGDVVTLYAQWNPITYTVRYDKNAADADGTTPDSAHTYDVDKTLSPNAYNRTGYTFAGWSAESGGGGAHYTDGEGVNNLTVTAGDVITLYARWIGNTATIEISVVELEDAAVDTISGGLILSRSSTQTATITVQNGESYNGGIRWVYQGETLGNGSVFTLNVDPAFSGHNYAYNFIGKHLLTVMAVKDGVPYSVKIEFEVTE